MCDYLSTERHRSRAFGDNGPCRLDETPYCFVLLTMGQSSEPGWRASAKLSLDKETPAVNSWQDINEVKRFVCAFPVTNEKTPSNEESL